MSEDIVHDPVTLTFLKSFHYYFSAFSHSLIKIEPYEMYLTKSVILYFAKAENTDLYVALLTEYSILPPTVLMNSKQLAAYTFLFIFAYLRTLQL